MTCDSPFDPTLVEGVRAGDPDAFAVVWRALCPALVYWLRSQLHDPGLAEDLAQSTFLELVEAADRLPGDPRAIRAWLYRAARHNLIDHRRHTARRPELVTADLPETPAGHPTDEQAMASAQISQVHAALQALTAEQRQVVTLRFLAELSAPEVAAVMQTSEGAVRALQRRGVAALARQLHPPPVPTAPPWTLEPS